MTLFIIGAATVFAACYLLGSINWAVIISKTCFKDDVRTHGSGSAGTTNMMRTYGTGTAALTFFGDILKGAASVLLARWSFFHFGFGQYEIYAAYAAGFLAVIGHMFPVYFHFKGGKGVATGLGAVLLINPPVFGIIFPIGLVIAGVSGFVSLASLSGAVLYPILVAAFMLWRGNFDLTELILAALLAGLIIYNHRSNIARLKNGTENKFYKKKEK